MGRRVLFCASEAYPLMKTGGLGDVAGSLPRALANQGVEVRLLLPAYADLLARISRHKCVWQGEVAGHAVRLLQTTLPGSRVTTWLVDCPPLFDRPGNPYHDADGDPWPDNAERFALFCRVAVVLANDDAGLDWRPEVVHCHDWQTGLIPMWLAQQSPRPATLFTIHNLAYQGLFERATFDALGLPPALWRFEYLEFHQMLSFIKGGLAFADRLTTVSPHYAEEIQTPPFGHGLDGLLRHRRDRLCGILNGIDTEAWNPGRDPHLVRRYNRQRLEGKAENKRALQRRFDLAQEEGSLLVGVVSRLAEQKGFDLVIDALPHLLQRPLQLVVLGSGDRAIEEALRQAARRHPHHLAVEIGYDEGLAHLIEGGADLFLMPSRFEPCGLNQMYSQRYGTLPLVTPVGGLYDTVVDASAEGGNGFVMAEVSSTALLEAMARAEACFRDTTRWRRLQQNAMGEDFSWRRSAGEYCRLYELAVADHHAPPP